MLCISDINGKNQRKPVTLISDLTDNSMYHLLYLPKQFLMPCQSQQLSKMRHILSHSWLNKTGEQRQLLMIFTITAKCRSKGMITPSVIRTVWKQRYASQKQNSGHHFIYLEDYNIQRWMNKQTGFNVEQIEKDNYPESKTVWRLNLKWRVNTAKQKNRLINKINDNNKRR